MNQELRRVQLELSAKQEALCKIQALSDKFASCSSTELITIDILANDILVNSGISDTNNVAYRSFVDKECNLIMVFEGTDMEDILKITSTMVIPNHTDLTNVIVHETFTGKRYITKYKIADILKLRYGFSNSTISHIILNMMDRTDPFSVFQYNLNRQISTPFIPRQDSIRYRCNCGQINMSISQYTYAVTVRPDYACRICGTQPKAYRVDEDGNYIKMESKNDKNKNAFCSIYGKSVTEIIKEENSDINHD